MEKLNEGHLGQSVMYKPTGEVGKIRSFNNETDVAFVVYGEGRHVDDTWRDGLAEGTFYNDLEFVN